MGRRGRCRRWCGNPGAARPWMRRLRTAAALRSSRRGSAAARRWRFGGGGGARRRARGGCGGRGRGRGAGALQRGRVRPRRPLPSLSATHWRARRRTMRWKLKARWANRRHLDPGVANVRPGPTASILAHNAFVSQSYKAENRQSTGI
jgi:hypothetical protein